MKNITSYSIIALLLLGLSGANTFVNDDCDVLRKENEKLKQELQKAQELGAKAAEEARMQQILAEEARSRADRL